MLQLIQCGLSSVALCASVCYVLGMVSTHLRRIAHICARVRCVTAITHIMFID